MKKMLLTAAIAALGIFGANAQTEQGNWKFGGSSNFSFNSNSSTPEFDGDELDSETTITTINFSTDASYFVIDNLAVGLELMIGSTKDKTEEGGDEFEYTTSTFGVLPQATYYFTDGEFVPFAGAKVGYLSSGGEEDEDKFSGIAFGAEVGVAYFINNNISIDLMVEYLNSTLSNKEEEDYKLKNNTIGVGIGFSIFL